jgi:predicted kinase
MPIAYILVGVPASGKSTWVANQKWAKDCVVTSTDKFVDEYAISKNKTYSEVFNAFMPTAIEYMLEEVREARENNDTIVWDQTSTTVASRAKKIKMLSEYHKIAVVFKIPEPAEHQRRLNRPGKVIPKNILKSMIDEFQIPTFEEGFDEIWNAE